jgi:hypothetical protein
MRSVWEQKAYRSHSSPPRSSTPGRYRTSRPPPTKPAGTPRPCTCTRPPSHSTGRGAPDAGACPRLQQTRPADPISKPMRGNKLAARGDSANNALIGSAKGRGSGGSDTSPTRMHDSFEKRTGGLSQEGIRRLMPGRRGNGSGSTQHASHAMHHQMRQ